MSRPGAADLSAACRTREKQKRAETYAPREPAHALRRANHQVMQLLRRIDDGAPRLLDLGVARGHREVERRVRVEGEGREAIGLEVLFNLRRLGLDNGRQLAQTRHRAACWSLFVWIRGCGSSALEQMEGVAGVAGLSGLQRDAFMAASPHAPQ